MATINEVTIEQCLELLKKEVVLIKGEDDKAYAKIKRKNGNPILMLVDSINFLDSLRIMTKKKFNRIVSKALLKEMQEHAGALARNKTTSEKVYIRYKRDKKKL